MLGFGLGMGLGLGGGAVSLPLIESVQPFEITLDVGDTSKTATITAVDTSRSLVLLNGWHIASSTDFRVCYSRLALTNSTTVTATRNTSGVALVVRGVVVQFSPGKISSIQTGTITIGTGVTSNTATITSVDTARSIAVYQGNITNSTVSSRSASDVDLTNATTVTATRGDGTSSATTVGYAVVQFAPGVVESLQKIDITIPADGASTSANQTITAVTLSRTIVFPGGNTIATSVGPHIAYPLLFLANTTTATAQRNSTSGADQTKIKAVAVQFNAAQKLTVQRARSTIAINTTTKDTDITAVTTTKAGVNFLGFTATETTNNEHQIFPSVKLQDSDTVRIERGDQTVDEAVTASWEVFSC